MNKYCKVFCLLLLINVQLKAQLMVPKNVFTHADTLRGSNGPGRIWWDALKYDIHVKFNIDDSTISGYNIIQFKTLKPGKIMQIDLQEPLILDSVKCFIGSYKVNLSSNSFEKEGNAYFIKTPNLQSQIPKLNNENF